MGAGGEDGEAVLGRDRRHGVAKEAQFGARLLHAGMGNGRRFDLRLQEFAADAAAGRVLRLRQEGLRHLPRNRLRLGVDEKILLFNPQICMRGASGT